MSSDPQLGRPAPGLRLPISDGGRFDLAEARGTKVLVSFLSHAA